MSYPFNNISGINDDQTIKVVVEIPKNSSHKIEWSRLDGYFVLDRVEPGIFNKPVNYGFIPQTLDGDGDELDVLIVTDEPLPFGVVVPRAKVLGVLHFEDSGDNDHKIICVPADDRHQDHYQSIYDLGSKWQQQIAHHFEHYKDLKEKGTTKVGDFADAKQAWQIIKDCHQRALKNPWW
ncbi:MAG: inorganic diphosphatase [Candidatus Saccharibacteria bacterium]|nr:inorganic diphosphatase [Candidatus Saccharibacteria bacterium]